MGDYPVSPLWHVSRLGTVFYLILLFLPLRSVKLSRSDALPTAQPVYACVLWSKGVRRFSRSAEPGICWPHIHASQGIRHWETNDRVGSLELQAGCTPFLQAQAGIPPSQFFPWGKNGPPHSFPGEKVGRPFLSPPSQFPPPLIISKIIMELLFH